MASRVRKFLAELMGVEKVTDEDLRAELDELKIDNRLEALTREGHINANPEAQMLARKAITGQATPDELEQLIRAQKPAPAQTSTMIPAAGPTDGADPTEAAIQAEMAKSGTPYHVAAVAVSAGATIAPPIGGDA